MRAPTSVEMVKAGAMAFKTVVSGIPKNVKDRELLEEDLRRIGCHGLIRRPWGLRMKEMVSKLISDKDNWLLVAQIRVPSTRKVDGEGVAEGLRIRKGGQGDGFKNRLVH